MQFVALAQPLGEQQDSNDCKFKTEKMPFLSCGYILVEHNSDFRKTFFCFKFTVIELLVYWLPSPQAKPAWPF